MREYRKIIISSLVIILASYKDYNLIASISKLVRYFEEAGVYDKTLEQSVYKVEECIKLRKSLNSNTYGMVIDGYQDIIDITVPARIYGAVLFDDWKSKYNSK